MNFLPDVYVTCENCGIEDAADGRTTCQCCLDKAKSRMVGYGNAANYGSDKLRFLSPVPGMVGILRDDITKIWIALRTGKTFFFKIMARFPLVQRGVKSPDLKSPCQDVGNNNRFLLTQNPGAKLNGMSISDCSYVSSKKLVTSCSTPAEKSYRSRRISCSHRFVSSQGPSNHCVPNQ